jgi:hypothetical protein
MRIRMIRNCLISGEAFEAGEILDATETLARAMVTMKRAEFCNAEDVEPPPPMSADSRYQNPTAIARELSGRAPVGRRPVAPGGPAVAPGEPPRAAGVQRVPASAAPATGAPGAATAPAGPAPETSAAPAGPAPETSAAPAGPAPETSAAPAKAAKPQSKVV